MFRNIIYSPLVSLVFLVLSNSFIMTLITVKLNFINTPESIVGYIHSAFYAGMLVGAIKSEALISRVGHIRAYATFSAITTITMLLLALFQNPMIWILIRFVAGLSVSALYVIIESWLLSQSDRHNKGKILSLYMLCLYMSQASSQFFLEIVDIETIYPFLIGAFFSSLSIIPACLTYVKEPAIETEHRIGVFKYFRISPFGFVGCVISGLLLSVVYSFFANYAQDQNLSISLFLGITIAGGCCLQWPIGKLSDIFDRAKVLTVLSFLIILPCFIMLIFHSMPNVVYFSTFVLGGLCFTIYPVSIAQVSDHIEHSNILNVIGSLLFSYGIGAVLGPPITAYFIEIYSSTAVLYYMIVVSLSLFILGIYTIFKVKPILNAKQVDFVAMPRNTPIANKLDPRV